MDAPSDDDDTVSTTQESDMPTQQAETGDLLLREIERMLGGTLGQLHVYAAATTLLAPPPPAPVAVQATDALTGLRVPLACTSELRGRRYDHALLSEFWCHTGDLRLGDNLPAAAPAEIAALAAALGGSSEHAVLSQRVAALSLSAQPPCSEPFSRVVGDFFASRLQDAACMMLQSCEIGGIFTLSDTQTSLHRLWGDMLRALGGLLTCNPLRAGTSAAATRTEFAGALAACDGTADLIHEPLVLQPVTLAVVSLCTAVVHALMRSDSLEAGIKQLQGVPPPLVEWTY
jgi:hypothetical protein